MRLCSAILGGSALALGACGPTTEIYQVSAARYPAVTYPWQLEVDVEECRVSSGDRRSTPVEELGFVEIGRGCQLPIRFLGEKGSAERRFDLVGGPYACQVQMSDVSIRAVSGTTFGTNELHIAVDLGDPVERPWDHVEMNGDLDGSRSSEMICGRPTGSRKVATR